MTDTNNIATTTLDEFTITCVIDTPRELVFKAWTDPAQFAQWFGPIDCTVPLTSASMDPRTGGEWYVTMINPANTEYPLSGVYRDVVEPERLVFTLINPLFPGYEELRRQGKHEETITVTLTDYGGTTEMVFRQAGHFSEEVHQGTKAGWTSYFKRLAYYLEATQKG